MRKIITTLVFIAIAVVAAYLYVTNRIIPNIGEYTYIEWIELGVFTGAVLLAGIYFVLFVYRNKDKRIKELQERLREFYYLSVPVVKAKDEVVSNLPVGILIYDDKYQVRWVNKYSKKVFNSELLENKLLDIHSDLYAKVLAEETKFVIRVDDEFYDVIQKREDKTLYIFNETLREVTLKRYHDRTPVIGMLTLENFEMETKTFDLQETARITSQFLGVISEWSAKYNAYLKSYDDDNLVMVLDDQNLRLMIQDKFDIVAKIREISLANDIHVTLSIGVACWDISYEELSQRAQAALTLAERRGGDQVVVDIQNEKPRYFGATTNALEKNNLSAVRANTSALKDLVEASSNIYIMAHNMADTDALGACIGALRMILTSKKPVKIIMDYDRIDVTVKKIYSEITETDPELFNYFIQSNNITDISGDSLLLMVDTQSQKIAMNEEIIKKFKKLAVIDHHRSSEDSFPELAFSYIDPAASSSVELISEMFLFYQKERIKISAFEATLMLCGLVVDTNNFTFRCNTRTFEAASRLREYGADMVEIRRLLRNDLDLQILLSKYLQSAEVVLNQFAICAVDGEAITDRTMLAKVAENLLNIVGIEASFVISNYKDGAKDGVAVSARSYKDVNVQLIMEEMGGGGHLNSAATQIYDMTVEEVKEKLIAILQREYEIGDESMKVILLEDVKGRGVKDQVIEVATGYGNYLITNKKGILATDENLAALKEQQRKAAQAAENEKKLMQKFKSEIEEKCVNIYIKIGTDGKLFGKVTTKLICDEFEAQTGIHIDKRKVSLPVEINKLGVYTAVVDLHKEVQANLEINVLEK